MKNFRKSVNICCSSYGQLFFLMKHDVYTIELECIPNGVCGLWQLLDIHAAATSLASREGRRLTRRRRSLRSDRPLGGKHWVEQQQPPNSTSSSPGRRSRPSPTRPASTTATRSWKRSRAPAATATRPRRPTRSRLIPRRRSWRRRRGRRSCGRDRRRTWPIGRRSACLAGPHTASTASRCTTWPTTLPARADKRPTRCRPSSTFWRAARAPASLWAAVAGWSTRTRSRTRVAASWTPRAAAGRRCPLCRSSFPACAATGRWRRAATAPRDVGGTTAAVTDPSDYIMPWYVVAKSFIS